MPTIHLTTFVEAPADRVFDLARSIDLHKKSMSEFNGQAVAGTTTGLIELDETVTWKAKLLFKTRILKIRVTQMQRAVSFTEQMISGDLKSITHEHHFKETANGSILINLFHFETAYGIIGRMINTIFLTGYLKKLLESRNRSIKEYAESEKWKFILQK